MFDVHPHVLHQDLLQLLVLFVKVVLALIKSTKASKMVLKGQLLPCFLVTGEVRRKPNGMDIGQQLHHIGCGEVTQKRETAKHSGPRMLRAEGDEVGPWDVARIAQVLEQSYDGLVKAWVAENLLLAWVNVIVDEVEHCDKLSRLQREILGSECGIVVFVVPQEVEDAPSLCHLELLVPQWPRVLHHLGANLGPATT